VSNGWSLVSKRISLQLPASSIEVAPGILSLVREANNAYPRTKLIVVKPAKKTNILRIITLPLNDSLAQSAPDESQSRMPNPDNPKMQELYE